VPPKSKRLPRAVREQQMMDAAVSVFARRGYSNASMDEVAERAGISKPMVYLYLGSKEELFLACIQREVRRFGDAILAAADPALEPDQQLQRGLRAFFTVVAEHRDAWAVLHEQAPAHGEPFAGEAGRLRATTIELVGELIARAVRTRGSRQAKRDDTVALAHALVGSCESLADWTLGRPAEPAELTTARAMNFAWQGLDRLLHGEVWHPTAPLPRQR
jgi:AcrR family transcriptional regulator